MPKQNNSDEDEDLMAEDEDEMGDTNDKDHAIFRMDKRRRRYYMRS